MRAIAKIHEFFVEGRNIKTSHVLLHISEPSTPEELPKGSLFALMEITAGTTEQIAELQKCIDDLEAKYYSGTDNDPQTEFEHILEAINRKSHHLLQGGAVDAVIGVICENTVILAYHGEPIAHVFYKQKDEYKALLILSPEDYKEETQFFSSVLSGTIQINDYFFVATPSVAKYFSPDRIQKIITARDAESGSLHMERVLANLRSDVSFGGIITKLMSIHDLPKTGKMPPYLKQGSANSLQELDQTKEDTNTTLNPTMMRNALRLWPFNIGKKTNQKNTKPIIETAEAKDDSTIPFFVSMLNGLGAVLFTFGSLLLAILERLVIFIKDTLFFTFYITTNYQNKRRENLQTAFLWFSNKKQAIFGLSLISKMLLGLVIVTAVIFMGSIIVYRGQKIATEQKQIYTDTISSIQNKYEAAQARVIYGDTDNALSLLLEARALAQTLDNKKEDQKKTQQTLLANIEEALNRVRNQVVITPTLLAVIPATETKKPLTTSLIRLNNTLIAFGAGDKTHYSINMDTGAIVERDHEAFGNLQIADTPKENDTVFFLTNSKTATAIDPTTLTFSAKEISFPEKASPVDMVIYNRRAYVLDALTEQIYKYNPTASGFDKGTTWIQQKTSSLGDAVSLAIDGDIFVLTQSGKIQKYVAGKEELFSITGLDPALTSPTRIWTYTDVDNLYILEPSAKRVIVLDKTGKLLKQYTATEWQNPTDMVIDEKNKTVYILDNNSIYSFTAN